MKSRFLPGMTAAAHRSCLPRALAMAVMTLATVMSVGGCSSKADKADDSAQAAPAKPSDVKMKIGRAHV